MSVLLMSAMNWLGYATAGVTALAIAMWLLSRLCRVRSPGIQQFAWLVVLLPGIVVWRMSVVLPVLPAGHFAGVDPRPLSDVGRGLSDVGARGRSLGKPNIKPRGYRLLVPQVVWGRFSTLQRRSILRHELAHYVRGDLWRLLFARLLAWPQWFNPLAWLAVRQFEEAAECACDDAVVAASRDDAFDYLRALLELGRTDISNLTLQAAFHGGSLQCRVRRLLSPSGKDSAIKKLVVIAAALSLVAGGMARIQFASALTAATDNRPAKGSQAYSAQSYEAGGSYRAAAQRRSVRLTQKTLEFSKRKSCVEKRFTISDEPDGPRQSDKPFRHDCATDS